MSDGISDANAEAQLERDIWMAACDLKDAVVNLGNAAVRARRGHRGWGISLAGILTIANDRLQDVELELCNRGDVNRTFHDYGPRAYDRRESWREKELAREVEQLKRRIAELEKGSPDYRITGEGSSPHATTD